MKRTILLLLVSLFISNVLLAQSNPNRIQQLSNTLDSLTSQIPGLSKTIDLSINSTELTMFLKAIASSNGLNISADPNLKTIAISQSFSKATTKDVLLYLCKEYELTLEVIGNILIVKKYIPPYKPKEIPVFYNRSKNLLTADIQRDSLAIAFRKITKVTGKNLVFSVGIGNQQVSAYIKDMPFDAAIDKIALANQLKVTKTKDNFYVFESISESNGLGSNRMNLTDSFYYKVKDSVKQVLEVNFRDAPIESIINEVAYVLKVNMATSKPLKNIGTATIKSDNITFDKLLSKILEDTEYTFKLENGMYFFGESKLLSIKNVVVIPLMNRSIELMMEPLESSNGFLNNPIINTFSPNGNFDNNFSQNRRQPIIPINNNRSSRNNDNNKTSSDALQSIFPKGVLDSLDVKADVEQNSFIVRGSAQRIERFKSFVKKIDKSIPLIVIEVMIIEVNKSASVSAGIELGLGDAPTTDKGTLFPNGNLTLGATSINRVIGGLNGFGSLNIGKVVPNFYAKIQALETNGDLKVRSTPKLSALNGHTASLSNGQRTYFTQTLVNTISGGVNNPQTQTFENYIPIDANLSIKIKPLVSGDGSITLSIDVQQSSFSSTERIDDNAPPNIDTRQFNSTVRVKDQDVVVLGGLEVNSKSDSGSGVPFLARIPVIKWLFSKRVRTASDSKLSVLIRPTIVR